jgi:hypothetical protein
VQCERCGAVQPPGSGYCAVCAAPLGQLGQPKLATSPRLAPEPRPARTRWLTIVVLVSVAGLLLLCLLLTGLALGLSSLIRWS